MAGYDIPSAAADAVIAADHPSPENGGPCATCAFRPGTQANQSWYTMALARMCVEGITPFSCHEQPQACRGWIAAVNLRGAPNTEDDRRWCEASRAGAELIAACIDSAKQAEQAAKQ